MKTAASIMRSQIDAAHPHQVEEVAADMTDEDILAIELRQTKRRQESMNRAEK